MKIHSFLFHPAIWIGEGNIELVGASDKVHFFTKWIPLEGEEKGISWRQEVELHNLRQTNVNLFTFFDFHQNHFKVQLENDLMGIIVGKGNATDQSIAWELRNPSGSSGYEVFELQENGDYQFFANYMSTDQFRTHIEGKIWRKN